MADAKITELTELTLANVSTDDVIPIVDSGITKKISLATLFQASSGAATAHIQPYIDIVEDNYVDWTNASAAVFANSTLWTTHTDLSANVSVGQTSLVSVLTGYRNTALGVKSLSSTTNGSGNVAVGYQSLALNSTGNGNTAVGYNAGYANVIGTNNTYIGNQATGSCPDESNAITLGNGSIKTLRCQAATITSVSDERDKKDILPLNAGLEFINNLAPVSFNWNMRDGSKVNEADTGFLAQDLLKAQQNTNCNIPGLVSEANSEKLEASYGKLIPVLVKAIQELSEEVKKLKNNG